MSLNERVLALMMQNPGIPKSFLASVFGLSHYRLNRVFRHLQRGLSGRAIVHDEERGVWIVAVDDSRCLGMDWIGCEQGGYRQCSDEGIFPDHCCYEHSKSQALEMVAFIRCLSYLTGPADPSARALSQLTLHVIEELISDLEAIVPLTRRDVGTKLGLSRMLAAAQATLRWKDAMRRRQTEPPTPHDYQERMRYAPSDHFEYSLKKFFATLELSIDADKEQVMKAWKRLAFAYHPDVRGMDGNEEKMKAVNLAKERIFRAKGWD